MSNPRVTPIACAAVLACVWLGGVLAPRASAACANSGSRVGPSERLPDCRAYEQVSPSEKGGADALSLRPLFPAQASPCEGDEGCSIAYMNAASAFDGSQGNELPNAYISRRAADWQTTPLTPPTLGAPADSRAEVTYAFSADLSHVALRVPLQPLTENAPTGVYNLFVSQAGGRYSLITTIPPPVPPQPDCGSCFEQQDVPAFAGASRDFDHVVFEANDSLDTGAPGGGVENLYESFAGQLRLVGFLPDGAIPSQGASGGGGIDVVEQHSGELANAISQDGSHIVFQAAADGGAPDPAQAGDSQIYDRLEGASSVEISAPATGAEPSRCETSGGICNPEPARFWAASADGSVVFFTSKASLTKRSYTGTEAVSVENPGNDLYRYDVADGSLTDLTAYKEAGPAGANVLGVVGASQDGADVYFVAAGALEGHGSPGAPNLYFSHSAPGAPATVKFIATLRSPSEDEEENLEESRTGLAFAYHADGADWSAHPTESQAYVTPDGRHLAFMSVEPLTGYGNEDPRTHEADHEVFEYSAETGRLECASCDASGAQPLGSAFIGGRLTERASTPFHQPRALSDDGSRLFFSSPDPLVPGLSGGNVKVFEYTGGAAQLISGQSSEGDDAFLDASASGDDVFFATRSPLAPSDHDALLDVYDARVGGGVSTPGSGVCQGSCEEAPAQPPSFPVPASASFVGPGDLAPPPAPRRKLTRQQLLRRALARCAKLKRHKQRLACIHAARHRYGPKPRRSAGAAAPTHRRP
jgi:hypothetical protein